MIQRAGGQAGDGAGEGAGGADRTVGGLAIRGGRIGRVLQTTPCWVGIGHAQDGDVAVARGVVVVIAVTAWVVTVGAGSVVKVTSSP